MYNVASPTINDNPDMWKLFSVLSHIFPDIAFTSLEWQTECSWRTYLLCFTHFSQVHILSNWLYIPKMFSPLLSISIYIYVWFTHVYTSCKASRGPRPSKHVYKLSSLVMVCPIGYPADFMKNYLICPEIFLKKRPETVGSVKVPCHI